MGVYVVLRINFLNEFYCFTLKIVSGILLYPWDKALHIHSKREATAMKVMNDML